jgi:hypothetical protein
VSAAKGHDVSTDTSTEEGLILILKGMDTTANPRNADYLGDLKDAKKTTRGWVGGLVRDRERIQLLDPWGRPYLIRFDGDGDGYVADPATPGGRLARKIIVWSAGKDGDENTWEDNVTSWGWP